MNYTEFKKLSYIETTLEKYLPKELKDIIFNYYYQDSNELILQKDGIKWKISVSDNGKLCFSKFSKKFQKWAATAVTFETDFRKSENNTDFDSIYGVNALRPNNEGIIMTSTYEFSE